MLKYRTRETRILRSEFNFKYLSYEIHEMLSKNERVLNNNIFVYFLLYTRYLPDEGKKECLKDEKIVCASGSK